MADRSTACRDWSDRLLHGRSIVPPPIFPERAAEALDVFTSLRIVDAPGSPTYGECCAPWVFDLVASIFGAYDVESGRRLITEWFVCVPKKNAKSTIAAGIMITAQVLNWRQSAEFAILAPTIEIANNSFAPARDMVQRDEELEALLHVQTHIKTITHRESGATLKVVAADSQTVGGKKSVGTLVDELWLFGMEANAENMLREATGGLASRPEGFVIYLTTQSDDPPAGVFAQKLKYARDVRDGIIDDPRFVPVIYEFPPDMPEEERLKPSNFGIVNPNLGYSVDEEFLRRELLKARASGPESLKGFRAKHLNIEVGLSLRSDAWAGALLWEAQSAPERCSLEAILQRADLIEVGIDGGGLDDLLGFCVLGRCAASGDWLAWCHAWAHPQVLERRKEVAPRLLDFAADGDLTIVQRVDEDVQQAVDIVMQCEASGLLDQIGVDSVGIGKIFVALRNSGIEHERIRAIGQGWQMNGAIKDCERALAGGSLWHTGSRLMAWVVGNARIEQTGNAVRITKQVSGTAKIDPLIGLLNAAALMVRAEPANVVGVDDDPVFA